MALTEGTYVILSALDTGYALDVKGGSGDENGTRVQLYARNDTDAQIVRAVRSDGGFRMLFLLSGKALDRVDGGTADKTPLQQWNASPTNGNQLWAIEPDGGSVEAEGQDLPTYTIANPSAPSSVMDVASAKVENGTRLQMYTANGTDAQRWAFLPLPPVPDGTWRIHSALSGSLVLDVAGNSQASGANVQVYSDNGTNAQAWATSTSGGITTITNAYSGNAMDVKSNSPANGANVQVCRPNGTQAQQWVVEPDGETQSNGASVPLYVVHAVSGEGRVLDVKGAGTAVKTNVQVYDDNGTDAQRFWFEPTEYLADALPVPSGGGVSESQGGPSLLTALSRGPASVYPTWLCDGDAYQARYRVSERSSSDDASDTASFGEWMDARTGSTGNGGWGDVQSPNVEDPYREGTRVWSPHPVSADLSVAGIDRVDVEFECRRFAASYGPASAAAHGNPASFSAKLCWEANVSGIGLTFTPKGIRVSYSSDFPRGGNTMTVEAAGLFGAHTFQGIPASGYVEIPISDISAIPDEGETHEVSMSFSTCDASMPSTSQECAVAYGGSHGTSVSVDASVDGYVATLSATSGSELWLLVPRGHGDRLVKIEGDTVAPPLGVPWRVFAVVDSGGAWASGVFDFPAIEPDGFHLTTLDASLDYALTAFEGYGGADAKASYEKSSTASETAGREREVVGFGSTVKATWSLSGVVVGDVEAGADAFDAMAHERYAVYRDPLGMWAQVAILSASIDRSRGRLMPVAFSLEEVEL